MKRLIDDLLSLSRVEMRAHLRPGEQQDLVSLLRHVIDTLAPLAKDNGVGIEAELPAGQILVPGDRDELVQVFSNLIENACKYGHSGRRVIVRLTVPEGSKGCSVAVIDFGPGIAPEHLPRLTERFYRVDAEESRRHRGTGLGLAIVKHIVSRHRGRLQIESQPGHGAQFIVHFPECKVIAPEAPDKTTADQSVAVS
jgi:two-component system phosphate regulon sensor histidine kinase PhoR